MALYLAQKHDAGPFELLIYFRNSYNLLFNFSYWLKKSLQKYDSHTVFILSHQFIQIIKYNVMVAFLISS
jgi:hypothetical protein